MPTETGTPPEEQPPVTKTETKTETETVASLPVSPDVAPPEARIDLPGCERERFECVLSREVFNDLRRVAGRVTDEDPSEGVAGVEVSIVRTAPGGCRALTGTYFVRIACGEAFRVWLVAALDRDQWALAIPPLSQGRYTLRARASDFATHRQDPPASRTIVLR